MRLLKKIVLGVIGGILAVYLLFAIGLTVLEWIVRENPKVEESLQRAFHRPSPAHALRPGRRLLPPPPGAHRIREDNRSRSSSSSTTWMTPPASSRRR